MQTLVNRFTGQVTWCVNAEATPLNAARRSLAISDMCADSDVSAACHNYAKLLPYGVEMRQIARFYPGVLTGTHGGIPEKIGDFCVNTPEIIGPELASEGTAAQNPDHARSSRAREPSDSGDNEYRPVSYLTYTQNSLDTVGAPWR